MLSNVAVEDARLKKASLASNKTVNNSVVLVDTDLVIPVYANELWMLEINLFYTTNGTADLDIKLDVPAGATARMANTFGGTASNETDLTTEYWIATTIAANQTFRVTVAVATAAAAGNITLQFAQHTATVVDTIVKAGSSISAIRVS